MVDEEGGFPKKEQPQSEQPKGSSPPRDAKPSPSLFVRVATATPSFIKRDLKGDEKAANPLFTNAPSRDHYLSWIAPEKEEKVAAQKVSTLSLLKYSTTKERWYMILGLINAALAGTSMPAWLVLLNNSLDKFNNLATLSQHAEAEDGLENLLQRELMGLVVGFASVGAISLVTGTLYVSLWTYTGERQALRIKERYVESALRQDAMWFDSHNREELPTKIAGAMGSIKSSLSRHIPDTFANVWSAFGCLGVAIYLNAALAIIMLCVVPVVALFVSVLSIFVRRSAKNANEHFSWAGGLATEVFSGIKTIASLCAERLVLKNYKDLVGEAQRHSTWSGIVSSIASGMTGFLFYCSYTVAFIIGTEQVASTATVECFLKQCSVTGATVMTCIYGVILSATFFSLASPGVTAINIGRQAAVDIYDTINHVPDIDATSDQGIKLKTLKSKIHFKKVFFAYPTNMKRLIFKNFDLMIKPGTSVALVGPSGSGKSTISRLLLRFYDPVAGHVLVDGIPLDTLNLSWWRDQIGYVPQEPALFPGTIAYNIKCGKPDATTEEIHNAAKAACAHEFITQLPSGYDTFYSGASIQLSGGQMQRIVIARAIIRNPAVLLLDEATSALDTNSERRVQDALAGIRRTKSITTITVAHRLSTIVDSDQIAVISDGEVTELGTHRELLLQGKIYAELCASQGITLSSFPTKVMDTPDDIETKIKTPERKTSKAMAFDAFQENLKTKKSILDNTKPTKSVIEKSFDEEEEEQQLASISRLWEYSKQDWMYMLIGVLGACITGALPPSEGILTAQIVANFYIVEPENLKDVNRRYSLAFLILACLSLFGNIAMGIGFSTSGQRLTRRMRVLVFESIIRRNMGWFDVPQHSTGELTSRLEADAEAVSKVTGWALGHRLRVFASLSAGVIIALVFNWVIGLIAIACVPLIMIPALIQAKFSQHKSDVARDARYLTPNTILEQGLRSISAVQAYNLQDKFIQDYSNALRPDMDDNVRQGAVAGLVYGFSQFAIFISFAVLFLVGSQMLVHYGITFVSFFTSLLAVMFGALGIAQVNADFNARQDGLVAATRIFDIVDEPIDETSDPFNKNGEKPADVDGAIVFKSVAFAYPTRLNHPVYYPSYDGTRDGFNLDILPKQSIAFVGKSGCGKSTALQIFLRFYNALSGDVLLDNRDILSLNLRWLRNNIGYVGQQPVLFAGSIAQNILLGKQNATADEVENAAKAANAHHFITRLSEGYDTDIGVSGSLLSGGQKQRIAIARAIIKNPKILILDEATAALDNESERIMQGALDDLHRKQPRTTMVVAHRLVTVRKCDKIAVLDGGGVKELGNHNELLEMKGLYHELWTKQGAADE